MFQSSFLKCRYLQLWTEIKSTNWDFPRYFSSWIPKSNFYSFVLHHLSCILHLSTFDTSFGHMWSLWPFAIRKKTTTNKQIKTNATQNLTRYLTARVIIVLIKKESSKDEDLLPVKRTFVSQCWFEDMVCRNFASMRTLCWKHKGWRMRIIINWLNEQHWKLVNIAFMVS